MEAVEHMNEICDKSLNKCTIYGGDMKISMNHVRKHLTCPCARSFQSNKLLHFFPVDEANKDSEINVHFKEHDICLSSQVCCLTCKTEIGDHAGNASIRSLLEHASLHEMDEHCVPQKCQFSGCTGVTFYSLLQYIEQKISVRYLELLCGQGVSRMSDGQFYTADNPEDEGLRSAGYKARSASRSASPNLEKKHFKKGLEQGI